MPLIHLSVQHGHTFDEAKRRLETTVHEFQSRFSALVQQVEWSTDRSQVRLGESDSGLRCRWTRRTCTCRQTSPCSADSWVAPSLLV